MSARRLLFFVASIAVSVGSLALILRSVPFEEVLNSLSKTDPVYLLLTVFAIALSLLTRGVRWWILLNRRISVLESFHMINVMFLGNQLPFRLGEVARGVLATRRGVPLVTSGTSIVVERLIDVLMLVLLIAATVSRMPDAPADLTDQASLLGLLALVGFLILLIFAYAPASAHRLLDKLLRAVKPLQRLPMKTLLSHLLDGLQPLTDMRTLLWTALWTLLAWTAALAALYFSHRALGIEVNYSISVPLGIALTAISIAMPISIAALGPFEFAIVVTGRFVGMSDAEAIALGFLLHGINVISYAAWGTIGLLALGASPAIAFGANSERSTEGAQDRERNSCTSV
ncbi:MAG: lysylphosphatidylglycerol synthase transmembrane domain-containing protein [Chloroflexi bacterium]|nr:lysylphosphatidylglycerol synthase transmembrane domain-containing protein [Chloroflexota bacterium]